MQANIVQLFNRLRNQLFLVNQYQSSTASVNKLFRHPTEYARLAAASWGQNQLLAKLLPAFSCGFKAVYLILALFH